MEAYLCRFCNRLFINVLSLETQLSGGEGGIQLTGLTPPHFYACPKPGPEFPMYCIVVFFVFSEFSQDETRLFILLIFVELITITV